MHLHITDQSIRANKSGNHIHLVRNNELVGDYLLSDVETAAFYGAARPTTDVLLALLESGTDITFLSKCGHFKGRMVSSVGKNVNLRLAQYNIRSNPQQVFDFAKELVLDKVSNGFSVLDSYHRNQHSSFSFTERRKYSDTIRAIKKYSGDDLDKLRGLEGICAKIYFGAFARCINESSGLKFPGRQYRPSTDPVNSLLSLGYAFVSREIETLLISYGFDPMIGFLHQPEYGRASLALDVMEEFRHPLVDRLVLKLINHRIITSTDFEFRDDGENAGQLYLKKTALTTFIQNYEQICSLPIRVYEAAPSSTWRQLMRERVESLRRNLIEGSKPSPITFNFKMQENE